MKDRCDHARGSTGGCRGAESKVNSCGQMARKHSAMRSAHRSYCCRLPRGCVVCALCRILRRGVVDDAEKMVRDPGTCCGKGRGSSVCQRPDGTVDVIGLGSRPSEIGARPNSFCLSKARLLAKQRQVEEKYLTRRRQVADGSCSHMAFTGRCIIQSLQNPAMALHEENAALAQRFSR
jgi:hypothetical protein